MKRLSKILTIILAVAILFSFGCKRQSDTGLNIDILNSYVTFFETEEDADCSLVKFNDIYILIDTGEKDDGETIVEYLNKNNIRKIDYIIFSHFDKDHCGGAKDIIKSVAVDNIIRPDYIESEKKSDKLFKLINEKNINVISANINEKLELDGITLELFPREKINYTEKQSNNSSLMVKVTINNKSILYTGDIQEERLSDIITNDYDLSADILKMPYHGREIANEDLFFKRVNPKVTVVTGKEKKVRKNIDSNLELLGTVYYTQKGNVTFSLDDVGIIADQ